MMKQKQLQKKYTELIKSGTVANGRKETISFFHKAAKVRAKLYKKNKITCSECNGVGFKRISIETAKTCLACCGRGFTYKEFLSFPID